MMNKKNTKKEGVMSFLYFKEKGRFVGVCLEFNIVEEGKIFEQVNMNLKTACQLHLETVQEKKLSDTLLNRNAPKEYWDMYESIINIKKTKKIVSSRSRLRILSSSLSPYSKASNPSFAFA